MRSSDFSVECRALVDAWTYRPAGSSGAVVVVVYDCVLRGPGAAQLTLSAEHTDAQWFDASLVAVDRPECYKRSIRRAAGARR